MKGKIPTFVDTVSEAEISRTLADKSGIQKELTGRLRSKRKTLSELLNEYQLSMVYSRGASTNQDRIDEARLAVIKEYELFAGKGAATSIEIRDKVARRYDNVRRKLSALTCPGTRGVGEPVHMHSDGTFWFFDETWADELGPFADKAEADKECDAYADQLLGPQWSDPPNARGEES